MAKNAVSDALDPTRPRIKGQMWNPLLASDIHAKWPSPPIAEMGYTQVHEVLDLVTAAFESGRLGADTWPMELFASEGTLREFLGELESYDEIARITDRWWHALAGLTGRPDEEGFSATRDIALVLTEQFEELNARVPQWPAPTPVKKARAKKAQGEPA